MDLFWAGHYHSYERVCPAFNDTCVPFGQGPVHITIGSAGASIDTVGLYGKAWSQFYDDDWGIGRITVANRTALHWEYLRNKDNTVVDEAWVHKEGHRTTTQQGCACKEPWGLGDEQKGNFYTCMNPFAEGGNWCYTADDCGMPASPQGRRTATWDFCDQKPQKTQQGCTCKNPWTYNSLPYYGCAKANEDFKWCYTGDNCGTQGSGGSWDKC